MKFDSAETVWEKMVQLQGETLTTVKGLEFRYRIVGNEIFVDRKKKSITRSSVNMALEKIEELDGKVSGPKKLQVFGASYLYPIFLKLGLIIAGKCGETNQSGS